MIYYLATGTHAYCMENFLRTVGASLRDHIRIIWYEDLYTRRRLDSGTYILSDIERLSEAQRKQLTQTADRLIEAGMPVVNHPRRLLCRYDLLRTLHERGINPFRAIHLDEDLSVLRYPVFLRIENNHSGPITPLLHNRQELQHAIDTLHRRFDRRYVIIVEFADTRDVTGIFRKYSAMIVDGEIQPRHVLFSNEWCIKFDLPKDPKHIAEERQYQKQNPHEAALREIFQIAGYEYGRIDYAWHNGRPVVWEINSNPVIASLHRPIPERVEGLNETGERLVAGLRRLAERPAPPAITIAPHTPQKGILHAVSAAGAMLRRLQGDPIDGPLLPLWRHLSKRLLP